MSLTRYGLNDFGNEIVPDPDGGWVSYDDAAEAIERLEARVRELGAQLAARDGVGDCDIPPTPPGVRVGLCRACGRVVSAHAMLMTDSPPIAPCSYCRSEDVVDLVEAYRASHSRA